MTAQFDCATLIDEILGNPNWSIDGSKKFVVLKFEPDEDNIPIKKFRYGGNCEWEGPPWGILTSEETVEVKKDLVEMFRFVDLLKSYPDCWITSDVYYEKTTVKRWGTSGPKDAIEISGQNTPDFLADGQNEEFIAFCKCQDPTCHEEFRYYSQEPGYTATFQLENFRLMILCHPRNYGKEMFSES